MTRPLKNTAYSQAETALAGATLRAGIRGPEEDLARKRFQDPDPKLVNGKWRIRWRRDVIGADGKPSRIAVKTVLGTKAELPTFRLAKRAAVEFMETVNARDYRPGKIAELHEFAVIWQRDALPLLKGSSQSAAKGHISNHLNPVLGDVKLENLRPQLIQGAVAHWAKTLERKTILNILGTLQSMMREARNWGYTVADWKMEQLILPRKPLKPEPRCFTDTEVNRIIDAAEGQWKAMFCLLAMTGIRRGEMIALQWSDIDLEAKLIRPRRSYWQGKVDTLKTDASLGVLPIPDRLVKMLRWYLGIWRPNTLDLVFASQRGTLLNPSVLYRDVLRPLLDKLEIPHGGFHAFRHALSSELVSEGANPKVLQKQMRHSDVKTSLSVYAHLVGSDHRDAVERVAEKLCPVVPLGRGKLLRIQ